MGQAGIENKLGENKGREKRVRSCGRQKRGEEMAGEELRRREPGGGEVAEEDAKT